MPPKKNQKVDSEECNKICIIHFSKSNEQNFINLFQAADKDKKFEKIKQIALNVSINRADPLTSFLNNVSIFPPHL